MCSNPSLRSFLNFAFETVLMSIRLTMALSHPFKEGCLVLPLSTPFKGFMSKTEMDVWEGDWGGGGTCTLKCFYGQDFVFYKYFNYCDYWKFLYGPVTNAQYTVTKDSYTDKCQHTHTHSNRRWQKTPTQTTVSVQRHYNKKQQKIPPWKNVSIQRHYNNKNDERHLRGQMSAYTGPPNCAMTPMP